MRKRKGSLTPKERLFAKEYAATGSPAYAAHKAGYASPDASGSRIIARPEVAAEALKIQQTRLRTEVLPLAVKRHLEILQDASVTGQSLNRAIELAYKYGMAAGADGEAKAPSEMTPQELGRAIDALKRAAADAAKPVLDLHAEPEPNSVFD